MHTGHLSVYLNDHLAGSVAALELLDRLIETSHEESRTRFFAHLRDEIEADQQVLKKLIQELGENESTLRKAGGWLVEKLTRPKIPLDESRDGEMGLFLALETLLLGITGKKALWLALAAAAPVNSLLAELDCGTLILRADGQRDRVEAIRQQVACSVFKHPAGAKS